MKEEKIREALSDRAFVAELLRKETAEEVQAMLADKDIEVTIDAIHQLKELLVKKLPQMESGEELSEADLEEVSGGVLAMAMTIFGLVVVGVGTVAAVVDELVYSRW